MVLALAPLAQISATLALIAALVCSLAGCAAVRGAATEGPQPAQSAAPSTTRPVDADPTAAPGDADAAVLLARAGLVAFCRPRLSRAAWIASLDPFLTLQAASAYVTVDPSRVPCRRLLGRADGQFGDAFTRVVMVPTDAGAYAVTVSRAAVTDAWRVSALVPAKAAS